jgi:hypothetical protein
MLRDSSEGALCLENTHIGVGELHGLGNESSLVVRVNTKRKSGMTEDVREEVLRDIVRLLRSEGYRKRVACESIDDY